MAVAATGLSPMKWPNPTEAAIKWVEMGDKACKAWTDACLQIVTTFSTAARTQAEVLASLKPPVVSPEAIVESVIAPIEAVMDAASASIQTVALIETPPMVELAVAAPVESATVYADAAPKVVENAPPAAKGAPAAKIPPAARSIARADKPVSTSK